MEAGQKKSILVNRCGELSEKKQGFPTNTLFFMHKY